MFHHQNDDMKNPLPPVIFLPGAGGETPNLTGFWVGFSDATRFETLTYPRWQRFVANGFSPEVLIADLAAQITMKVPQGKIRLVGFSIGGHLGYAVALHLEAIGREIAGFCLIDAFLIESPEPFAEIWAFENAMRAASGFQVRLEKAKVSKAALKGRAISYSRTLLHGLRLLRKRRIGEFIRFARSRFWRVLLALTRGRLPNLVRRFTSAGQLPSALAFDPIFEEELSMRMLILRLVPWMASLDLEPVPLKVPTILIRSPHTAGDEAAWRRRCPNIQIFEIPGQHQTLFEPENIETLRETFNAATGDWHGE
jgi:thioesterase domain-containing protein